MTTFAEIYDRAAQAKGVQALEDRLPACLSAQQLAALPDHRVLAAMTKAVFQAGFVWRVINNKWDAFEAAFFEFDPSTVATLDAEQIGALMRDARIVRNGQKITATIRNAGYVQGVSAAHDGFGRFLADWPAGDTIGLWAHLKANGARLGGATGPRTLRQLGRDTFILTDDVCAALVREGVVAKKPTSKRDLAATQAAFEGWRAESGRALCELSVVLACSV